MCCVDRLSWQEMNGPNSDPPQSPLIPISGAARIKSAIRQIQSSSQDVTQHQNRPVRPDGTESGIQKEALH